MSERPSTPSTDFAPPPHTQTPGMPIASLRGKRRTSTAPDENGSSRIPVASPPASSKAVATRIARDGGSKSKAAASSQGGKALRPPEKSSLSVSFPTSSKPALPVLTATHAGFAEIAYRILKLTQAPTTTTTTYELGKRPRPSATRGKPKEQQKKPVAPPVAPLWRELESQGKVVIAETLDYELLGTLPYGGSMVTPKMLREGLLAPDTAYHAWVGAKRAIEERPGEEWDLKGILDEAMLFYLVELGDAMLDRVDGPHYTFVDPGLNEDASKIVQQALRLAGLFAEKGYGRERIIVTIPATEAGVQAAKTLESKHHVRTNLTLVSGLAHAAACAEAGATSVTLCYREVSDASGRRPNMLSRAWEALGASSRRLADEAVQDTVAYFGMHELQSAILVANLQNTGDVERLGQFDAVAFTAHQSNEARVPEPRLPPAALSAAAEQATQRARQVQYPTSYLASRDGVFLSAMPVDARTTAKLTLSSGLENLKKDMHQTSVHMLEFIQGEAQVEHLDVAELQEFYELDEMEAERLEELKAKGKTAEYEYPVRWYDVGFRLRFSSWDQPVMHRAD